MHIPQCKSLLKTLKNPYDLNSTSEPNDAPKTFMECEASVPYFASDVCAYQSIPPSVNLSVFILIPNRGYEKCHLSLESVVVLETRFALSDTANDLFSSKDNSLLTSNSTNVTQKFY